MTTHIVSKKYPPIIPWERWCRNGQVPDGKMMSELGQSIAHSICHRKKVIGEKTYDASDLIAGTSGGPNTLFYVGTHTGHNVAEIRAIVVLAPSDDPTGLGSGDPYCALAIRDGFTGGSIVVSNEIHYGMVNPSSSDAPDDMSWTNVMRVECSPDTDYRIWLRLYNYARILSISIFEAGGHPMDDTAVGCIDPRCGTGQRVLDSRYADWLDAATKAWRDSGQQVANFIADSAARAPVLTAVTYRNLCDTSLTTVTSSSPGVMSQLSHHASRGQATVPVRMVVRGEYTGTGSGSARFENADGDYVEVAGITADGWYTAAGTLPAERHKYDFRALVSTVGASMRIDTISLWEEDP